VIFTSYRADQGSVGFDIIVANVDGTGITDVTPNSTMDHSFALFSPDGTKIAFAGFDPTNIVWGIWTLNADGNGLSKVISATNYDVYALPLTFSPDGKRSFTPGSRSIHRRQRLSIL
jgi:Tol biopolymer transport system component